MATPIVFNGVNYSVPAFGDVGYAQGPGNLSAYLIAIASGTLQITGGLFSLTADIDFGPNFGIESIYYKSRSANISSTGVLRLASGDIIGWRDFANANDLELTTNASDQLTFNGIPIASSSGALIGTTLTLTDVSNQMVIGSTNTTTVSFTAPAASRVYTVPDVGGPADFVMTAGAQTIAGIKTFSAIPVFSIGATITTGGLTVSAGAVTISATSNQIILGVTNTTTINSTAPVASRIYTIPDAGANVQFVMAAGTQTISGIKTFDGQLIAKGTTTNDNAAAGYIGEYVSSTSVGGTNFPTTAQWGDLTSISLTAGDWDVSVTLAQFANGATITSAAVGVSATAGNVSPSVGLGADNMPFPPAINAAYNTSGAIPSFRFSLPSTTTVYLKMNSGYSAATPLAFGRISARRVR